MNKKQNRINLFKNKFSRIPVGTFTTAPVLELMELSGAYRPKADFSCDEMVKLAMAQKEYLDFETVRYPFDMAVLAEAMGCKVDFGSMDRTPSVIEPLVFDEIDELYSNLDNFKSKGRIPTILDATTKIKSQIKDDAVSIAGCEGPVDLAASIIGLKKLLLWTLKEPESLGKLLDVCSEACITFSNLCLDHGADSACIADAIASPQLVPPNSFKDVVMPTYKKITSKSKRPIFLHICGNVSPIKEELSQCGFNGISVEESVDDLRELVETFHKNEVGVIGNVSPVTTLYSGTVDDVTTEAKRSLDSGIDFLAPGCGIAPQTPLKNLAALVETRNKYEE